MTLCGKLPGLSMQEAIDKKYYDVRQYQEEEDDEEEKNRVLLQEYA